MRLSLILGIVFLSNLQFSTSDPSINIDHLKKKTEHPEVVKKHSAKKDNEHQSDFDGGI